MMANSLGRCLAKEKLGSDKCNGRTLRIGTLKFGRLLMRVRKIKNIKTQEQREHSLLIAKLSVLCLYATMC